MPTSIISDSIASAVRDALLASPDILPGHKGAFLTHVGTDGISAILAEKINDNWQLSLLGKSDFKGNLTAGVEIKGIW